MKKVKNTVSELDSKAQSTIQVPTKTPSNIVINDTKLYIRTVLKQDSNSTKVYQLRIC